MSHIQSFEEYKKAYKESVENPESFWASIAEDFVWRKKWDNVLEFDFS
jgi:acetyl-CoA synthetase